MSDLQILPDSNKLYQAAAEQFVQLSTAAIAQRGWFTVALAGGSTPRPVYALLATESLAQRVDWSRVQVFWSDERCVPPYAAHSNYRMAHEALLDHVPLPPVNIHRMHGEDDPALAALAYEQELQSVFRTTSVPVFDLIWLGIGDNGHTASLFPGTAALREQQRWVVPQYVEVGTLWRVTFTAVLINAAAHVTFLVQGAGKAEMLWRVLKGPYQPEVLPAQLIQPAQGQLHWLVDAAAAARCCLTDVPIG